MKIKVTEDDIRNGERMSGRHCMIARALQREGFTAVHVDPYDDDQHVGTGVYISGFVPDTDNIDEFRPKFFYGRVGDTELAQMVADWDSGNYVEPFEFEVEL